MTRNRDFDQHPGAFSLESFKIQSSSVGNAMSSSLVFVVLPAVFAIAACYLTILFWQHRFLQPIKSRNPVLSVLQSFCMVLMSVVEVLGSSSLGDAVMVNIPCAILRAFNAVCIVMICQIYIYRSWRVAIAYAKSKTLESSLEVGSSLDLTLSISSNRDTKLSTANSASAASVARVLGYVTSSWTSNRFLGASIFLSLLLFCLQFVGMQSLGTADYKSNCISAFQISAGLIALSIYMVSATVIFAVVFYALRDVEDSFHIMQEVKLTFVCTFVGSVIALLVRLIHSSQSNAVVTLLQLIFLIANFLITIAYPLYFAMFAPPSVPTTDQIQSYHDLLQLPAGFESMLSFCRSEFSVENLLFWREIEQHHQWFVLAVRQDMIAFLRRQSGSNTPVSCLPPLFSGLDKTPRNSGTYHNRSTLLPTVEENSGLTSDASSAAVMLTSLSDFSISISLIRQLMSRVDAIHSQFISTQAELEINLPASIIRNINDGLALIHSIKSNLEKQPNAILNSSWFAAQRFHLSTNQQSRFQQFESQRAHRIFTSDRDAFDASVTEYLTKSVKSVKSVRSAKSVRFSGVPATADSEPLQSSMDELERANPAEADGGPQLSVLLCAMHNENSDVIRPQSAFVTPQNIIESPINSLDDDDVMKCVPGFVKYLLALFDEAQDSVFELMRRDSYPRYLKSHLYSELRSMLRRNAFLGRDGRFSSMAQSNGLARQASHMALLGDEEHTDGYHAME